MNPGIIAAIIVAVLILVLIILTIAVRYKTCPPDKIMVIYGKIRPNPDGTYRSAKCVHGGASFVVPFIQKYTFMDLTPLAISVDLKSALSKQNIRIDVPSIFTVGIATDPAIMQNAAERLRMLTLNQVSDLARDIIFGQLRLVIATMNIEEINADRDKFLEAISRNVEGELKKVGLRLINVNVTDISDESGYITALGKEAAAKAINDAKVSVAEEDKKGSIGQANAKMEERIRVAEAESAAIEGENKAKAEIARSQAQLREKEAEALKVAVTAEKVQAAKALEESYIAEKKAEMTRAARERATKEADVIVAADIEKQKLEIEAEAVAEQIRRKAKGEADAIFAKMDAEARGMREKLTKQALGMRELVKSAGTSDEAVRLLIADKLEEIVAEQVKAIAGVKFDKITVWDGGQNADGKTSTANFLSGLLKSLPPLEEIYNMAGLSLPKAVSPQKLEEQEEESEKEDK
ncbi:MAG: flotillin family protein [Clostridiales bacterium]|nr:flotillin family protein [Clostridiales bacterium]